MRKTLKKISLILVFAMIISGAQPSNILAAPKKYVKTLSVSKKTLSICVGKSKSLSYKIKTKGTASKKITVKVSNFNVKATKKKGEIIISAKKVGNSKLTISTKGKNKKGKKIKRTVKIKIIKKSQQTTPLISTTKSPAKTSVPETKSPIISFAPTVSPTLGSDIDVTKAEWISTVMGTTGYNIQKELFDYDQNGDISYSFTDISKNVNADIIETAVKYGIIPNAGGEFNPNDAADREFLAVTSVRAIGFATDELEIDYSDKDDLEYEIEAAIAIQLDLLKLSDNKFLPAKAITQMEKQNAERILSEIIESRKIDAGHTDVVEYSEDVKNEKEVTDYTISEQEGIYTVMIPTGTSLDEVSEDDKIVLPATASYSDGIALVVSTNTLSLDGQNRIITGTAPDEILEFVDTLDIEGVAVADASDITAVDGVATVEVTTGVNDEGNAVKTNNKNGLKRASVDGEIDLKDKTKISYTVKEIETTVSFYLSALKYNIDFNRKGVNEIYIGLPSVLSMDTNYKASKNFSKKIGDIPIQLAAGFSANVEVYLEASISGEITMNLKLSNNVGMQYYRGQFYVEKSCKPSFDVVVDADVDAGAKLQLGLYWMRGIKKVFGKDDPRPVYNVYTKWGMHGDATLYIRNDQYTSYENLACVDLAYYLYGNVSVGNGSFLGDIFDLKKIWVIYDNKNSPLKDAVHMENGKLVGMCTYGSEIELPEGTNFAPFVPNEPETVKILDDNSGALISTDQARAIVESLYPNLLYKYEYCFERSNGEKYYVIRLREKIDTWTTTLSIFFVSFDGKVCVEGYYDDSTIVAYNNTNLLAELAPPPAPPEGYKRMELNLETAVDTSGNLLDKHPKKGLILKDVYEFMIKLPEELPVDSMIFQR